MIPFAIANTCVTVTLFNSSGLQKYYGLELCRYEWKYLKGCSILFFDFFNFDECFDTFNILLIAWVVADGVEPLPAVVIGECV